jgi:ABC-type branched-subunit amino acid transport system substrate-binding protein
VNSFRRPPVPRLARRGLLEVIIVAVLVVGLTPPAIGVLGAWHEGCLNLPFSDGVSVRLVDVAGDQQCVGYSDSSAQVFGDSERLQHAQRSIFEENEQAEAAHELNPERPYISIVYFGGLTHQETDVNTDDALAEDLEGILLRQSQQNGTSRSEPLLRVIVANGGVEMRRADYVARELLGPLVDADRTIMGVVGFDRTVDQTERAIARFGALGVPTVGTPLTGSGLVDRSPLYFQLVPSNTKQAELVANYARRVGARAVTVYHRPLGTSDTYVKTLVGELAKTNPAALKDVAWKRSAGDLDSLCADATDHSRDLVFYAGREEEFGDFLRAVTDGCTKAQLPRIVASDAISRFMADKKSREDIRLQGGIRVAYVGMGSLVVLAGRQCNDGKSSFESGGLLLANFCRGYHTLRVDLVAQLGEENAPSASWPGERVGLTYDATGLFVDAVRQMRRLNSAAEPHRAAVAQLFRERSFNGVTGRIDFSRSRIGDQRNLALLEIADIVAPDSDPVCVYLIGELYKKDQPHEENGCPVPGK